MATPQLSPGVLVREVDLTVGRADNVLDNIGGIAGPFPIGPVNDPIDITTEQELITTFGKPLSTDSQYEYWMTASSYLSYGGVLKVVRTSADDLNNANAGVGSESTTLKIENYDDYLENHSDLKDNNYTWSAKNPGSWGNGMKVCFIDDLADQTLGITTSDIADIGAVIGYGVTADITGVTIPGEGTTSTFTGYLKGIITGITSAVGAGQTNNTIDVKIVSRVDTSTSGVTTETKIDYAEGTEFASFISGKELTFVDNAGINTGGSALNKYALSAPDVKDWYDQQKLGLTNSIIYWKSIAPKPTSNKYVLDREGKNDALHVCIVDDLGTITGNQGTILEKHVSLSKAKDAISAVNSPQKIWYEQYIADFSEEVYAGSNPGQATDNYWSTVPRATGFTTALGTAESYVGVSTADGLWGLDAQGVTYSAIGNKTYSLAGGEDYTAGTNGMTATLGALQTSYDKLSNKDEVAMDYLIMGPGLSSETESQAKAQHLLSIANSRKDCVATIGAHRANLVGVTNTTTQTDNLIKYFSSLSSTSYGIFDSGYKYTYDRFNNKFRYIPCNGDIAGLMCRTNIIAYPWFSPAGQQRGIINNAVKLAYNPNKAQRDQLYPLRINSVVTQPGIGTLLFGDKTALGYASAFDRINVLRLFLTVEQALQKAAEAQLF